MPSRRKRGKPGKRGFPLDWVHPAAGYPPWANPYSRRGKSPSSSEYDGSSESSQEEERLLGTNFWQSNKVRYFFIVFKAQWVATHDMKWNLRMHMTAAPGDNLRRSARRRRKRRERVIRKKGNLAARGPRRGVRLNFRRV